MTGGGPISSDSFGLNGIASGSLDQHLLDDFGHLFAAHPALYAANDIIAIVKTCVR